MIIWRKDLDSYSDVNDMEIDLQAWPTFFDNQGHLLDEYKLRKSTFFYGLSNDIR